jgi:hypothetical protein
MFTLHSPINHTVLENGFGLSRNPSRPGMTIGPLEVAICAPASKRPIRADARRFGRSGSSGYPRI